MKDDALGKWLYLQLNQDRRYNRQFNVLRNYKVLIRTQPAFPCTLTFDFHIYRSLNKSTT